MKKLTRKDVLEMRSHIENTEWEADFEVQYLKWSIVQRLKRLENKLERKEGKSKEEM